MLNYLSDYRTQDKLRGRHYYPSGALCWFETNQYGDPTGSVYFARRIPDEELLKIPRRQRGFAQLLSKQKTRQNLKDAFTRERADTEQWLTVKPRFDNKERIKNNATKKVNN